MTWEKGREEDEQYWHWTRFYDNRRSQDHNSGKNELEMFFPRAQETTWRWVAWENSRHFKTPPLVSPRNDVWKTSAAIPYWWRVTDLGSSSDWSCRERNLFQPIRSTTQILVVTRHWRQQYGILKSFVPVSQKSFRRETSGASWTVWLSLESDSW